MQAKIPTIVLDSGASLFCVKPPHTEVQVSEYGEYEWWNPLTETGELLDKIFTMTLGHTAKAGGAMEYNALLLQTEATQAHSVPGLKNNLGSVNQMVLQGYIPIFGGQKVGIYVFSQHQDNGVASDGP